MNYPLHFHPSGEDTAKAKLPKALPVSLRLLLAGKQFCVPYYDAGGAPILFLYDSEEYHCWREQLSQAIPLPSHWRLLQLLVQNMAPVEHHLRVSRQLLAYAHITCDAELCLRRDGLVWLTPGCERYPDNRLTDKGE